LNRKIKSSDLGKIALKMLTLLIVFSIFIRGNERLYPLFFGICISVALFYLLWAHYLFFITKGENASVTKKQNSLRVFYSYIIVIILLALNHYRG